MAVDFSKGNWEDEISEVTGRKEYQSCEIEIVDPTTVLYAGDNYPADPEDLVSEGYIIDTDSYREVVESGVVYSGQARFIPVRAGVHYGGEAQANSTTIRAVRFQLPKTARPLYIRKGLTIRFTRAERNPSLVGRVAKVGDDFQGSSSATRTIHASMDIDSGGPGGE